MPLSVEERRARHAKYQRAWRARNLEKARQNSRDWAARNPERIRQACARFLATAHGKAKKREHAKRFRQKRAAEHKARLAVLSQRKVVVSHPLLQAARAAVPSGLPRHVRDDVIGSLVLAALEGTIAASEMGQKTAGFVRAFYRDLDQFTTLSLDAPIPGMTVTYLDRLSDQSEAGFA